MKTYYFFLKFGCVTLWHDNYLFSLLDLLYLISHYCYNVSIALHLDLQEARDEGRFKDALKKYTNPTLLILDEWLLMRVTEKDSANLLELIHKRRKHSSTIFCSQYLEEDWYQKLGGKDNPLTDAIMDRISFDSYKIPIMSLDPEKDISMREVYGLDPSQAQ